jgi:hypothetical protein
VTTAGSRKPAQSQRVVDSDHRCNFTQIPHLLLDDVASGRLKPAAIVLYLHYKRVAFEQHGEPIDETLRETKARTGLSNGTILTARDELESAAWLQVDKHGTSRGQLVTITVLERWPENCEQHGHIGQKLTKPGGAIGQKLTAFGQKPANVGRKLTKSHLSAEMLNTGEYIEDLTPQPPKGGEKGEVEESNDGGLAAPSHQPTLGRMVTAVPGTVGDRPPVGEPTSVEHEILVGLYLKGLGHQRVPRTSSEIESARVLIADGATPSDAAAWAREALDSGIQLVTAATMLKAWPTWQARRRQKTRPTRSPYEHDPWRGRTPPIAPEDLARAAI